MNEYKGIPVPVIILLILAMIFTFVAKKTIFGRNIFMQLVVMLKQQNFQV